MLMLHRMKRLNGIDALAWARIRCARRILSCWLWGLQGETTRTNFVLGDGGSIGCWRARQDRAGPRRVAQRDLVCDRRGVLLPGGLPVGCRVSCRAASCAG